MGMRARVGLVQPAVAALTLLKFLDGLEQMGAAEIRPEGLGNVDFGVRRLPEQEVAQAHLAAGADHQIKFAEVARLKVAIDRLLIYVKSIQPAVARGRSHDGLEA